MCCSTSASTHQLLIPDITWNWEDMIIVYHLTFVPLSRAPVAQEFRRLVQVQILAGSNPGWISMSFFAKVSSSFTRPILFGALSPSCYISLYAMKVIHNHVLFFHNVECTFENNQNCTDVKPFTNSADTASCIGCI